MNHEYPRPNAESKNTNIAAQQDTTVNSSRNEIVIPLNSFTAFRLLHGEAEEVTQVSQVILLGSIPKIWFGEHKLSMIARLTNQPISDMKHSVWDYILRGTSSNSHERGGLKKLKKVFRDWYILSSEEETDDGEDTRDGDISIDNQFSIIQSTDGNFMEPDRIERKNRPKPNPQPFQLKSMLKKSSPPVETNENVHAPIVPTPKSPLFESSSKANNLVVDNSSESKASYFTAQESALKSTYSHDSEFSRAKELSPLNGDNVSGSHSQEKVVPPKIIFTEEGIEEPSQPEKSSSLSTLRLRQSPTTADIPNLRSPAEETASEGDISSITSSTRERKSLLLRKPEPENTVLLKPINSREELKLERFKRLSHKKTQKLQKDPKLLKRKKIHYLLARNYSAGEIIKSQRMLVLVKLTSQPDPSKLANTTELENFETRIYERWKEYIVVARSSGDIEAPIRLEFLTHRHELRHGHRATSIDFNLNSSSLISFYSALDKTILIGNQNRLYVLTCQSPTTAIGWLTFLREIQGYTSCKSLRIAIPDLNISMNLNIPNDALREISNESQTKFIIQYRPEGGYKNTSSRLVKFMSSKVRQRLTEAGYSNITKKFENSEHLLGVCWRHYDRLEWLYGENLSRLFWQHSMNETHDLELRTVCHYPCALDPIGIGHPESTSKEPAPIEGFLSRLTTRLGNQRRGLFQKQVFKFSYISTSNNLLFMTNAYKSLPPMVYSEEMIKDIDGFLSSSDNFNLVRTATPQVYYHNPYEFDQKGHFTWLKPGITEEEFKSRDLYAQTEFERRLATILRSESVINLTEVENVTICDSKKIPKAADLANNVVWDNLGKKLLPRDIGEHKRDIFFQIHMKNETKMILMAPNSQIRDEWITRLLELRNYWCQRIYQDILKIKRLKESNIKKLDIDDWMEANINEYTERWENSRGLTNPEIHNISSSTLFRPVIRNGELYQKLKKHSAFTKRFVVLVPGQLMVYDIFSRSPTGKSIPNTYYSHSYTIPLKKCYIFSGNLSGLDLLLEKESEFEAHPGTNSTPRVYADGWLSSDEEENLCFTLWFGKKRSIAGMASNDPNDVEYDESNREIIGSSRDKNSNKNPGLFHMVGRLGVTGKSMVFKCRSRQERDLWVGDLLIELDRFEIHNLH